MSGDSFGRLDMDVGTGAVTIGTCTFISSGNAPVFAVPLGGTM